jgi:hypothetical protein
MSWSLDKASNTWRCTEYSDLQYAEIINFAEYGQPRSPYEPGFLDDFAPDFAHVVIEMPQAEVMKNGYGQNVTAENFPIVTRFLKENLKFPFGCYSFADLVKIGFAVNSDRTITDSLYGSLFGAAVPGSISAADAAFIHGTVCFRLMASTRFTYRSQQREVHAEIGAGDDNWDFNSSTVPNVVNAFVAVTLGPDHYNLEAPIKINFIGAGKASIVVRSCLPAPLQYMCVQKRG